MPTSTHVHSSTGSDAKQTQVKHNPSNSLVAHYFIETLACWMAIQHGMLTSVEPHHCWAVKSHKRHTQVWQHNAVLNHATYAWAHLT